MKKTLSVVLTSAMALSMFSSVAFGKSSSDFTDLKDLDAATQAKFDAMISANIFDGVSDTTFGLKDEMNRAQFAKVAALIMGLDVNKDLKTSSFSDVSVSDAANGYALPYIEALKTANVTDGYAEGQYNPAGKVTKEQLATFLVRVLGKDAEAKGLTGTDKTVSGWAQGYVAEALSLKLLSNNTDGTFGGMVNATRDLLVLGSYEAKQQYVPAGQVSLTEAKATGVYKVTATFNKPVDTAKAVLSVAKGSSTVTGTTTWSDDKKTATITTDTKIGAGDYTVTLSGLDATTVAKATATFKAEDESVSKIDFVNAGDTVAFTKNAVIKLKAVNQYGENTSLSASSFTALVSGQNVTPTKDSDGNLVVKTIIDGLPGVSQGNGVVPVTVFLNNSAVTVTKNFKVGVVPMLSKIEAGTVTYPTGKTKLTAEGDVASVALNLFDQYGNAIVQDQIGTEINASSINPMITPYDANVVVVKAGASFAKGDLFDGDGNARVQVKLTKVLNKNADFTVNIYGGTSSATATVSVAAGSTPTSLTFDSFSGVVAAGDGDVVVPFTAIDANGTKLTAQQIADNKDSFNFNVSNQKAGTTWSIVQTGADKGKLKFTLDPAVRAGNTLYVSGQINQSTTNTYVTTTIPVQEARVPDHIAVVTEAAAKAIKGADSDFKLVVKDQYNKEIDAGGVGVVSANGQTSDYRVKLSVTGDTGAGLELVSNGTLGTLTPGQSDEFANTELAEFNKGFKINTSDAAGKITVKAVVERKAQGAASYSEYSSTLSRTVESIDAKTALTYSLDTVGTLYTAVDSLKNTAYNLTATKDDKFAKKLSIVAKDSAGNTVALPSNQVQSVSSSNNNVVQVGSAAGDGFVVGNTAGTATVTAIVLTNKGETINLSQEVTTKSDAITVATLTAGNTTATYDDGITKAYDYFTKDDDNQLAVTDQYGITYKNEAINTYDGVIGLRYTVKVTNGTGTVTVNPATGAISGADASTVKEFEITAIAPNGKTVQVLVSK